MVAKPLCPLYKNIIKPLDRARYPELRYSYIISLTEGLPTIQLPCNAGVLGMSSEEELPIAQSYAYYKGGGRYNIISVFDWNGKCLKHFSLKGMESQ